MSLSMAATACSWRSHLTTLHSPAPQPARPFWMHPTRQIATKRSTAHRDARRVQRAAAYSGDGGGGESESLEESAEAAFASAQTCMEVFCTQKSSKDLDAVIEFLPEAVIDRLLERKRAKREGAAAAAPGAPPELGQQQRQDGAGQFDDNDLSFEELVALAQPSDLAFDAYTSRGLLHGPPRRADVLSSLRLAPDRFLQRYDVVAQSGEEMVLIMDMQLEEALQPKYRGLQVVKKWFLRGITGEPAYPGDAPTKPEPAWGPDSVVLGQLEALQQGDVPRVFRFASPANQAVTGPVERFAQMLEGELYRPLLHHQAAELLRTVQMQPDVAVLIVGVRSSIPTAEPGVTQRAVYSWTVRLQGPAAGPELHNCWMTESVQPISQGLFK